MSDFGSEAWSKAFRTLTEAQAEAVRRVTVPVTQAHAQAIVNILAPLAKAQDDAVRQAITPAMLAIANNSVWKDIAAQSLGLNKMLQTSMLPVLENFRVGFESALAGQSALYSQELSQTLAVLAAALAAPGVESAVREQLGEYVGAGDETDWSPLELFANFVFLVVLMMYAGQYLNEANRTGEVLMEANRIGLTQDACWGLGIAWTVRTLILKAGRLKG